MNTNSYTSLHAHTDYSNLRLKDAINKVEDVIDEAHNLGLNGLAITDHETLAAHFKATKYIKQHKEKFENFKLILGNEIYLVDEDETLQLKEANEKIAFNHFILIAKDKKGYEFLRKQSTQAWKNNFYYRGMHRVPTYWNWLEETMKEYKGHIVASTACLGGQLPSLISQLNEQPDNMEIKTQINSFIQRVQSVFGEENFFFELQPSNQDKQIIVNQWLCKLSEAYGVKKIVTTDAHYLNKEQKLVHKIYLKSTDENRDVDSFYDTTYLMSVDELSSFFPYGQYPEGLVSEMMKNTNEIMNDIEIYDLEHETIIPKSHIPEFTPLVLSEFKKTINWSKFPTIVWYENSQSIEDKYYLYLILKGMEDKNEQFNIENLERIETELDVVKAISENFSQPMSSYFLAEKEFIDIAWEISLVGVARGSASCFYTNYLLDIVQVNPIKYGLPYWRFLNKDRLDNMPDIDMDAEGSKRGELISLVKERFGEDNVINSGTFTTEGGRSAVLTSARGIGLDNNEANNLLDLLPTDKGVSWELKDAFYGNEEKNRKPARDFINEAAKYPGLAETMLSVQGLVSGRSQHASGVFIFNDGYVNEVASMATTSGLAVTQFDAHDVESVGGIKYDFLSISALDRIHEAMTLLLKDGKIQWQGSLRKTYDKYFHPDVIDLNDSKMYDLVYSGDVPNLFQFDTEIGKQSIEKINARSFDEVAAANSLMRLTTSGEQPIDRYIKFKADIDLWYHEMKSQGLSSVEIDTLNDLLIKRYGICDTQEYLMELSMSDKISGFSLKQANKLRKSVAKKDEVLQQQEFDLFFKMGKELGTSAAMLNYVWNYEIVPLFGYAFSLPW